MAHVLTALVIPDQFRGSREISSALSVSRAGLATLQLAGQPRLGLVRERCQSRLEYLFSKLRVGFLQAHTENQSEEHLLSWSAGRVSDHLQMLPDKLAYSFISFGHALSLQRRARSNVVGVTLTRVSLSSATGESA